jgi:hypothetical protein
MRVTPSFTKRHGARIVVNTSESNSSSGPEHKKSSAVMFQTEEERYREALSEKANLILEHITRGIETYALWHHVDVSDVEVVRIHWMNKNTIVVEYACLR